MSEPSKPKREFTMEQRLMLAFALMAVVLLAMQYLAPSTPPAAEKNAQTAAQKDETPPSTPAPSETQTPPATAESAIAAAQPAGDGASATQLAAPSEQTRVVETDLYRVTFTNRGAVVQSWILKKYDDSLGEPQELVNPKLPASVPKPFALHDGSYKPLAQFNDALYVMTASEDGLGLDFEFSDGRNYAKKTFRFEQGKYLIEFSSAVRQNGQPLPHFVGWRGGFGDASVIGAPVNQHAVYYDEPNQKLEEESADDAEDGPQPHRGTYAFAGLSDFYFAAVALPEVSSEFRVVTLADNVETSVPGRSAEQALHVGAVLGGAEPNRFRMFVGPKDVDILVAAEPGLDRLVDWGWFGIVARPLFYSLRWIHDHIVPNWGWSIILITVIINLVLTPLRLSNMKSMRQMAGIKPEMDALKKKYENMPMRDPRKQKQNEEMMELYKKHGVNPLGGCLPMLLQMPFLFAFYKVLSVAIELRGANWLWVTDLSRPETLAIRVLPVAMVISQVGMQRMTPVAGDAMQQRMMTLLMPLMMGWIFYGFSSGLVLYWLTGNLISAAQQLLINRMAKKPATAPAKAAVKKSKK